MDGLRAIVRTIVDEVLGFWPDFITHQLTHLGHESQWTGLQPYGIPAGTRLWLKLLVLSCWPPLRSGLLMSVRRWQFEMYSTLPTVGTNGIDYVVSGGRDGC